MGHNATVVVMLDSLHNIKEDTEFGRKLSDAIGKSTTFGKPVDISSGPCTNVATVIEQHHADSTVLVAVGGNYGAVIGHQVYGWQIGNHEFNLKLLREAAESLGYRLSRIPKKKGTA